MILGPLKWTLRVLAALLLVIVLYFGVTFVQIWWRGHEHATEDAQAVLVFGTTEDNGTASAELTTRLNQALTLYREGRAPWVAVTGGRQPGDVYTEAGVSATYLENRGVPSDRILKGSGSDTWQNVETVLPKLKEHHLKTVITVTDPFHEYRAMAITSAQGLIPYPSPVRNSPTIKFELWRYYLKETLEVGLARIVGYGRLSSWTTAPLRHHLSSGGRGEPSDKIAQPFGGGVIGNTTGSGPVIQGSSPCPRANEVTVMSSLSWSHRLVA
ncbi:MAG: YdcF family protein [Acidimicrobiaceae bacterium]|nr:YdcF family protein [Acidimicrobiaceae bacterium]